MSASLEELKKLHQMVVKSLSSTIQRDIDDELPTDAATLGAAIKLLKDNSVTADPADNDELSDLREKLTEQVKQRRVRQGNVISMARDDDAQEKFG